MTNFGKRFRERARAASVAHEGFGVSFYTQTLGNKSHAKPRVVHFGKSFGKKARAAREGFWFTVDTQMHDQNKKGRTTSDSVFAKEHWRPPSHMKAKGVKGFTRKQSGSRTSRSACVQWENRY